jgi:hypothetical protein
MIERRKMRIRAKKHRSRVWGLEAFYLEHRRCGELEAEVTPEEEPSWIVMGCSCGARLARRIEGGEFLDRSSKAALRT